MHNYYPILWVGAIIGVISTLLIVAAFVVKDGEKETGFERNMKDSEIMQRLMDYAKPFYRQFIVVGFLMLFSIAYDIISPLIVGKIEELVVGNEEFLLGNVDTGVVNTKVRDEFKLCNVYAKEKCKNCFARFYCSGGCAANSFNFHGSITDAYDIGCEMQKKRIECAIMIRAALAEDEENN